jgi:MFS superfamily sulfate permease-like transporter
MEKVSILLKFHLMKNSPTLSDYAKSFPNDLTASIVVFLVALPLCLGVALASNAPLFSGIIAGVAGGIAEALQAVLTKA